MQFHTASKKENIKGARKEKGALTKKTGRILSAENFEITKKNSLHIACIKTIFDFGEIVQTRMLQGVVAHVFNPNMQEAKAGELCEFKTSLVYLVSFRLPRALQ